MRYLLSENKDIIRTCTIYEESRKLDYLEANSIIWHEKLEKSIA